MTSTFTTALLFSFIVKPAQSCNGVQEQRDIFESHRHHIFSVAYYMTGDEREAETILGSTFIRAFHDTPRPAVQRLDQALMTELRSRLSLEPVPAVSAGNLPGLGGRNVRRTDLEEALWQLPARERLCFLLRDVEGYSGDRVAGLLETTEADIQRTLFSARVRLRSLLIEQRRADA
jgi:RNA polymerase sigma-70 factor (ECF subfamily)